MPLLSQLSSSLAAVSDAQLYSLWAELGTEPEIKKEVAK